MNKMTACKSTDVTTLSLVTRLNWLKKTETFSLINLELVLFLRL